MTLEFDIVWKSSAAKELRRLDQTVRNRVLLATAALGIEPYPQGLRRLHGTIHTYRIRVGDYRVVFQVDQQQQRITIIRVRHRRDVYRG